MRTCLALIAISLCFTIPLLGQDQDLPKDFTVRTLTPLSASKNKEKDKFTVQVVSPESLKTALIEAEVLRSKASGKVSGKSELSFSFTKLVLMDRREIPI